MSDTYTLLTLLLVFVPIMIGAPTICCCLCRRCFKRDSNGLPRQYAIGAPRRDNGPPSLPAEDCLVYVYQYNPDGESSLLGSEGGQGGTPQAAYGINGRYYVPQLPLIPHSPYYDDAPPKYEDIVDLSVLDNNQISQQQQQQERLEPYRDEVNYNEHVIVYNEEGERVTPYQLDIPTSNHPESSQQIHQSNESSSLDEVSHSEPLVNIDDESDPTNNTRF
ncbi:hypothetical protein G9A89_002393 [Geosiphon pyriformis]|nr:hypothetical protein G9A89_002393 [Geosiphon pyriformis]